MARAGSRRLSSALRARGSPRAELGLITLEWLLIVSAIAGIAASSVLAVQIVIDDSTDRPARPDVRVVDAEIAAATVASEATEVVRDNPGNYLVYLAGRNPGFEADCEEVANEYSDVVEPWQSADWYPPTTTDPPLQPDGTDPPLQLDKAAICKLTRLP